MSKEPDSIAKNAGSLSNLKQTVATLNQSPGAMESLLAAAVDHAVDAIEITDNQSRIQYVNPAFERLTGYLRTEILGKTPASLFHRNDQDESFYWDILSSVSKGQPWQGDFISQRKDGSLYQQEAIIAPIHDSEGNITHYITVRRDITERKKTETTLKRYQLLSQHTRDIVLFIQADGQITEANDAAVEAYGYSREALLQLKVHDLYDETSAVQMTPHIMQASYGGLLFEAIHRRQDGSSFHVEVSIQGATIGQKTLLFSITRDITHRKRVEEKLFHQAFHDSLTNLPSRSLVVERLRRAIQQDDLFAVLALDLDGFKVINNSLGHEIGDQLLAGCAERLASCIKTGDMLARFGGDEFTILLENIQNLDQVTQIAERIQREFLRPFKLQGQEIFMTISIGIVLSTAEMLQPEDFLRSAETALHRAKALDSNGRYTVFNAEMQSSALKRLRLETDLRQALSQGLYSHKPSSAQRVPSHAKAQQSEFHVYYQPIISIKTLKVAGFEALVRWQHPERGLISPTEFIAIAEATGLIVPLGALVLREACKQMQSWQEQFPNKPALTISVNLSVKQFLQPNLVEQIGHILADTNLNPARLKLEITESAIMEDAEVATRMMRDLKALGVGFSLDDFGTGYSSLAYLHRLPIDTLKIDRSFINRIDVDGEKLEIVRTISTLAWNLGIDVVAEGVETEKQLAQLRSLRCDYGQGYLFFKPVTSDVATQILAAG